MSAVATVMTEKVRTSVDFRPIRSPRCPATNAPAGRARKPTPNEASAAIWPMPGCSRGKNRVPNTSALLHGVEGAPQDVSSGARRGRRPLALGGRRGVERGQGVGGRGVGDGGQRRSGRGVVDGEAVAGLALPPLPVDEQAGGTESSTRRS
jgi:hypothetical protein